MGSLAAAATGHTRSAFERRTPHRVRCIVRLIEPDAELDPCDVPGETINVATGGLAVRVSSRLAVGDRVEVEIPHPEQLPLIVQGHVAHCRRVLLDQFDVGIRFD
jgi:hypothetical protein